MEENGFTEIESLNWDLTSREKTVKRCQPKGNRHVENFMTKTSKQLF